jgi:4-alpha-glucanotransferase
MTPRTALGVEAMLGGGRGFGVWTNLYTVRSRRNWGFGDFGDLRELLRLVARAGGDFVGVNPLHAVANRGSAFTPYSPSSRLYRNLLYLDVEAVAELDGCAAARARLAEPAFRRRLGRLRKAASIDHEAVLEAKLAVLRELHRCFVAAGLASPRAALYRDYCAREGEELAHFATWEALADHFAGGPGRDWRRWPAPYRDPASSAVAAFRAEQAEEVAFRSWLQFEADAQLARVAARGRELSLAIGVYHDLAVGVAPDSADAWMDQSLFARGVAVGAPPDDYAPQGQNWGFQPLDPLRLRARGYRAWSRLLRASFAHAGALRVDHAMGLLRLFWIPDGRPCSEGTYVYQRAEDLLGILALESGRHRALAIAEDLGTVPEGFRELLADWGILSSAVLYFEREGGRLRPSSTWARSALATVETHDLVPLAGHADGIDLAMRRRVGAIPDDSALASAHAARALEHQAILAGLREEGLLPSSGEPDAAELCTAVHAFLARTPVSLAAASLDDLAREREPVNLPGVPVELHRSWSRRMRTPIEQLAADPGAARALAALQAGRPIAPARLPALDGRSEHGG